MARISSHVIEEKAENKFRTIICSETMLFRKLSGRDYGIDGIVEIFDNNSNPTGKIAYIQIKGTSKKIEPLKKDPLHISCKGISRSNLMYTNQMKIPFILIFCSTHDIGFYYKLLNSDEICINDLRNYSTVKIPINNYIENDITDFKELINQFYE